MRSEPCAFCFASVFMRLLSISKVTETRFSFRCFVSLNWCGFALGIPTPVVPRGTERHARGSAEHRVLGQLLALEGKQGFEIVASSVHGCGN